MSDLVTVKFGDRCNNLCGKYNQGGGWVFFFICTPYTFIVVYYFCLFI